MTFYSGETIPVFLITVFGKGEKDNLSKSERAALVQLTKELVKSYDQGRVVKVGLGGRP